MEVGEEVVNSLSENASPVDRVDSAESVLIVEFTISEKSFYDILYARA